MFDRWRKSLFIVMLQNVFWYPGEEDFILFNNTSVSAIEFYPDMLFLWIFCYSGEQWKFPPDFIYYCSIGIQRNFRDKLRTQRHLRRQSNGWKNEIREIRPPLFIQRWYRGTLQSNRKKWVIMKPCQYFYISECTFSYDIFKKCVPTNVACYGKEGPHKANWPQQWVVMVSPSDHLKSVRDQICNQTWLWRLFLAFFFSILSEKWCVK